MADTAISALSAASTLAGTEALPVVQTTTKKATIAQIGAYIGTLFGVVKDNTAASTDPGVSDDNTAGYSVRSIWINTATGGVFIARAVGTGAAVWMRMAISADFHGYISGNWYPSVPNGSVSNGAALSANVMRLHPFTIRERVTLSTLGARITTQAAGNAQFAIYAMSQTTKKATGNALAATGDVSTNISPNVINGAISGGNVTFEPGEYFFANNNDSGAGGTVTYSYLASTNNQGGGLMGSATQSDISSGQATGGYFLSIAQTYSTWPDLTGATFLIGVNTAAFHGHIKVA